MIQGPKPRVLVCGGRGTAHMVSIAKKAGVDVIEVTGYMNIDSEDAGCLDD